MFQTYRPKTPPTFDDLKSELIADGYRVSAGSYEDDRTVYACSVESLPGAYGPEPRATIQFDKATGYVHARYRR